MNMTRGLTNDVSEVLQESNPWETRAGFGNKVLKATIQGYYCPGLPLLLKA